MLPDGLMCCDDDGVVVVRGGVGAVHALGCCTAVGAAAVAEGLAGARTAGRRFPWRFHHQTYADLAPCDEPESYSEALLYEAYPLHY